MSLFRRAGQTFQETKQSLLEGSDGDDDTYTCLACERAVETDAENCPHCGDPAVVPAE
jgi:rubrerythrin